MINLKQILVFTTHFFQAKKKNIFPVTLSVVHREEHQEK